LSDDDVFGRYLLTLRKTAIADKTEHTDRAALEELLSAFAARAEGRPRVQHEPKRVADKGAPDFKVSRKGLILGYAENKAIGIDLDKVRKSDQIKRYQSLSQNIVLTDYLRFVWIGKNGIQADERLCLEDELADRTFRLREDRVQAVTRLLQGFFSTAPEGIGRSQELALALATRSRLLRDYLGSELVRQGKEHQEGRLYGLYLTFRDQVFHELTLAEFADAFAQMLAYGLFLARLNSGANEKITLHNAREHVPGAFRLIQELVDFLTELDKPEYAEVRWVVEEVLSIVNGLDLAAIHQDLSFRQRRAISPKVRAQDEEEHRLFERDPFIYFYEDYLKAYDKDMRKGRGVYYTPPPIVNFIVRAVDDTLKDSFGIKEGLADHKHVTVLDFACGTGTFLLEVFQRIFENIGGPSSGKADLIVREHILKNLYGFEYLIAPYTIAQLKLSQFLADRGHPLKKNERLQVFLTNTLEPIEPQRNLLLPAVTAEVESAQKVKDSKILVITGNPPYSGFSRNMSSAAQNLVEHYKYVDGHHFGERKHWLQDDYVKFIAFAQKKMDAVDEGAVGIISNHSWLDNPTFRGMRQSLMNSFGQIHVLDLHGNAKKKERGPEGEKDENVFDIEQGVAIVLFVKSQGGKQGVWHSELWGKRLAKYQTLSESVIGKMHWRQLSPAKPDYLFKPTMARRDSYSQFISIPDIFLTRSTGVQTSRDELAVGFSKAELGSRISEFASDKHDDEYFRSMYFRNQSRSRYPQGDSRGWKLTAVRKWARDNITELLDSIVPLDYRPFDSRYVANHVKMIDWPRHDVTQHYSKPNLTLVISRQAGAIGGNAFDAAWVAANPVDLNYFRRGGEYMCPLFLNGAEDEKAENLSSDFYRFLNARYDHHYTPEEILGYIYAVLHAPAYRARYAEFLRMDFPRIPFAEDADDFEILSKLGWALVETHLLRQVPISKLAQYHDKGDHSVEAVRYSPVEQAVWVNKTQSFSPVPEDVWKFHIGGYPVLDKYLKSRKGRTLSLDEINHVAAVAGALAFTIGQMEKIDNAYRKAFPSVDN
jgi:predicted helicase